MILNLLKIVEERNLLYTVYKMQVCTKYDFLRRENEFIIYISRR